MPKREFPGAAFSCSRTCSFLGLAGREIAIVIAIEGDNDKIGHRHWDISYAVRAIKSYSVTFVNRGLFRIRNTRPLLTPRRLPNSAIDRLLRLGRNEVEEDAMGGILTLLVIVYLVGIGVVLAPTVKGEWNAGTASEFSQSILQQLPVAAAWPVTLYHHMMDRSAG